MIMKYFDALQCKEIVIADMVCAKFVSQPNFLQIWKLSHTGKGHMIVNHNRLIHDIQKIVL